MLMEDTTLPNDAGGSISSLPAKQRGVWNGKITSDYGYRTHPVTGQKNSFHNGIDLASPNGTNIPANASGTVIASGPANKFGYSDTYGNIVVVRDKQGNEHLYAHMSKATAKLGSIVGIGANLGLVGSTGRSTGNHVHYSVKNKGKTLNPKNFMG